MKLKKPMSETRRAMLLEVIDGVERQGATLIAMAINDSSHADKILSHLISQRITGGHLVQYIQFVHGGDCKRAVQDFEKQVGARNLVMVQPRRLPL